MEERTATTANRLDAATRRVEIFGDNVSSDGRVERLRTRAGFVIYRIGARVLPFLPGSIYLFADPTAPPQSPSEGTSTQKIRSTQGAKKTEANETESATGVDLNADKTSGSNSERAASLGGVPAIRTNPTEYWLVDAGSGSDESNADLESAFRTIREEFEPGFAPEKIKRILLTHSHIDHFGGANELRRRTGAEVWSHSFESRVVSSFNEQACVSNVRSFHFLREAGVPESEIPGILDGFGFRPGRAKSTPVAKTLLGGETFGALKTFYLPGHSPGHLAFQLDDVILTGDLLLSKTLTQIWPTRMTPRTGVWNYIRSLRALARIGERCERAAGRKLVALPAHEAPIFDVPNRVRQVVRGMERRNGRLFALLDEAEEPLTTLEIARRMYWSGRPNREFFAISDVAARLEFLQQLGLISVANYDEISVASPELRFRNSFADAEAAENAVEQIFGVNGADDEADSVERDANLGGD
ncbi:MAG: MBL fold metallo-hydrolase [Thermoguttaceae bacterium]|nr:MBL fold metallo-hydrolase [Thermoguttaceae bacterium]